MAYSYVIELNNIDLMRGETEVFCDFSWKVGRGEHFFVMGNNGCGKTSLIEIIMGYLWPQQGVVRVLGETFGSTFLPDVRNRIGYVSPWIFKRMGSTVPVCNVVASGIDGSVGYWGAVPETLYKEVLNTLDLFSCADLAQRPFGSLSSGQQFKVIVCRALINTPELFLLDEPFAQLDIRTRMQAYEFIEEWAHAEHSPSIVLATHHLEDINDSFNHGLILKDPKTYISGSRNDLLTNSVFKEYLNTNTNIFPQ